MNKPKHYIILIVVASLIVGLFKILQGYPATIPYTGTIIVIVWAAYWTNRGYVVAVYKKGNGTITIKKTNKQFEDELVAEGWVKQ